MDDAVRYEVAIDEERVVGPVTIDQIRRALASGKLPPQARARAQGSEPWVPLAELLAETTPPDEPAPGAAAAAPPDEPAPALAADTPPGSTIVCAEAVAAAVADTVLDVPALAPASRTPAKKVAAAPARGPGRAQPRRVPRVRVAAAIALVAVAAVAAAVLVGVRLLGREPLVPYEAARLPRSTCAMQRAALVTQAALPSHRDAASLPEAALWSLLSEAACAGDGSDVYRALMNVGPDPGEVDLRPLARALGPRLAATQLALRCGRNLARAGLGKDSSFFVVSLGAGGERPAQARIFPAAGRALPDLDPPLAERSWGEHAGGCRAPPEAAGQCGGEAPSLAFVEGHWLAGELAAVDELVRAYDRPASEPGAAAGALGELGAPLAGYSWVKAAVGSGDLPGAASVAAALDLVFEQMRLSELRELKLVPADRDASMVQDVAPGLRGAGSGLVPWTEEHGFRLRLALLARDAEASESAERTLGDLRRDWSAHLHDEEASIRSALAALVKERPGVERDHKNAMLDLWLRALGAATVECSGPVVTLDLEAEPDESERRRIESWYASHRERSGLAARVVRTLASGRNADPGDLERLAGGRLVPLIGALPAAAPH
ncbi:MAG: DUF4339 domain-containing protein [Deltaproteobacteria bacterium]|nr:DUF4339 domain-containing protein [Deltaproteobacteria bacterium]